MKAGSRRGSSTTDDARKHGIADDDMLHAFHHPISYEDLDEGFAMIIGLTRSAHLIELGFIDTDHGPVIVHAMTPAESA